MSPMISAALTNTDMLMLSVIFVLLLVLILLAVAEMGLSKMTKPKAAALADEQGGQDRRHQGRGEPQRADLESGEQTQGERREVVGDLLLGDLGAA